MIKIGFITSPLTGAHSVRGVGFYTKNLLAHLHSQAPQFDISITEISPGLTTPGFDLIHYPFFDLFYHTLPFFKSAKTVVTIHDVIPLEFPRNYPPGLRGQFNLALQKASLASVAGVITDSYTSVQSIHKYLRVPHSRIKLVYLAASEIYRPGRRSAVIARKYHLPAKFALYVGDVNWNKNLSTLIEACLSLSLDLVIVGKQATQIDTMDASHPELSHIAKLRGLFASPLTHRLGFVPDADLAAIYNLATVYCQPSFAEGFGLPVLEAMSCGTPVICSQTPSLPEIAGDAAIYFDPYQPSGLNQALIQIVNNSQLQKDLSKKGVVQAQKFSWTKTAENTLLSYQNFL